MSEKDKRVKLMSEIIRGIRVIKYYVWEKYFIDKIGGKLIFILFIQTIFQFFTFVIFRISKT